MDATNKFDSLIKQLLQSVPDELIKSRDGIEKNLRASLQGAFIKMDLVTREEYDVQVKLLQRTREKLEELEELVKQLEHQLDK